MKTIFSIIVPVKEINNYILAQLPYFEKLKGNFEVIILPDKQNLKLKAISYKLRIYSTGKVGPAEKRDLGAKKAGGEILAFIDDDAYPKSDWLEKAQKHFQQKNIAAVGGPAITPQSETIFQKVSASCFESFLYGSFIGNRYLSIGKPHFVDDWPSVNLLIRKNIFQKLGGFDSKFWPGEDTKFCHDLVKTGQKIIYEPACIVWHHRRENLAGHLKQVGQYGIHRGFFVKKYPRTSLRPYYFAPSLLLIFLLATIYFTVPSFPQPKVLTGGIIAGAHTAYSLQLLAYSFLAVWIIYFLLLIYTGIQSGRRYRSALVGLLVIPTIFLTHLFYGLKFFQGLLEDKLVR